jgi:hypothetical protein
MLLGSIPPDPETGFNGFLWFVGERIIPGSWIRVSYMGVPIKVLPSVYDSSQLVGVYVYLTVPGDYIFEALAPDGSLSTPLALTIPQGHLPGLNPADPELHMVYPPDLRVGFAGTVWLMGDNFAPGASLLVQFDNAPPVALPLIYMNERSLGWITAMPVAGAVTMRVVNPDLRSTIPLTLTVTAPQPTPGHLFPAPALLLLQNSVGAPFLGTVHLYGSDFLPGALLEVTAAATGQKQTTPLVFLSSAEMTWMLAYPQPGSYEIVVVNPDGQRSAPWTFDVR